MYAIRSYYVLIMVMAVPASAERPSCNWGQLTSESVSEGFDQGGHSSDPSDDGHGPGTLDEPRAGLANVVITSYSIHYTKLYDHSGLLHVTGSTALAVASIRENVTAHSASRRAHPDRA